MIKVLLIDDHAVVRAGYRRFLEADGRIEVVGEAADADAGLRAIVAHAPAVAVLDLSLPGRGGLDLLRHLGLRGDGPRVLVFSMHDSLTIVRQALSLGAAGYVTKASDPAFLVEAVVRVAAGERVVSPDVAPGLDAMDEADAPHLRLTPREFDVFLRLARGESLESIAAVLHLSVKTVANLQTAVRQKFGVDSAVALHRYARERSLID